MAPSTHTSCASEAFPASQTAVTLPQSASTGQSGCPTASQSAAGLPACGCSCWPMRSNKCMATCHSSHSICVACPGCNLQEQCEGDSSSKHAQIAAGPARPGPWRHACSPYRLQLPCWLLLQYCWRLLLVLHLTSGQCSAMGSYLLQCHPCLHGSRGLMIRAAAGMSMLTWLSWPLSVQLCTP